MFLLVGNAEEMKPLNDGENDQPTDWGSELPDSPQPPPLTPFNPHRWQTCYLVGPNHYQHFK